MGIIVKKGNGNVLRFLQACLSGLQTLNDKFYVYIFGIKEDLKFNGQGIYLVRRLNDLYDNTLRRIYIVNQQGITDKYVFRNSESQTTYVYRIGEAATPFYIGRISEQGTEHDFIIYVPVSLVYVEDNFNATVSRYKLVNKRYKIEKY